MKYQRGSIIMYVPLDSTRDAHAVVVLEEGPPGLGYHRYYVKGLTFAARIFLAAGYLLMPKSVYEAGVLARSS